jgi:EAL domain-containing protein (putative c-di-GMP-specific phosphodiesterase class I)
VIAQSIVSLADALGMTTIAEGVETPEQLDALPEIGARAGQGYLGAPAVMVEDLPETLDRLRR